MAREIGPMIAIFSETKPACHFFFVGFLTTPVNIIGIVWRKVRREGVRVAGLSRPQTASLHSIRRRAQRLTVPPYYLKESAPFWHGVWLSSSVPSPTAEGGRCADGDPTPLGAPPSPLRKHPHSTVAD